MARTPYCPMQAAPETYQDNDVVDWLVSGVPLAQQDAAKAMAKAGYKWTCEHHETLDFRRRGYARRMCRKAMAQNGAESLSGVVLTFVLSRIITSLAQWLIDWLLRDQPAQQAWGMYLKGNKDVRPPAKETDPAGSDGPAGDPGGEAPNASEAGG